MPNPSQKSSQIKQRLDKTVSSQGALSRAEAKIQIRRGEVQVNDKVVKSADFYVNWSTDTVALQGKRLSLRQHIYLMLNKPKGYVSATEDNRFPTVVSLVPEELWRKDLFPAGRLDKDTTGFILITDDGNFAHDILSPKKHVAKTYIVQVDGEITQEMISGFASGVSVNGEYVTLPAALEKVESGEGGDTGRVILREGLYHQIKRMFKAFGLNVLELQRVKMGLLDLDPTLLPGQCRELTPEELDLIRTGTHVLATDGEGL